MTTAPNDAFGGSLWRRWYLALLVLNLSAGHSRADAERLTTGAISGNVPVDASGAGADAPLYGCSTCAVRSQLKKFSLDNIKQHILNKLGFTSAPNVTGLTLPDVPPLNSFIEVGAMQGDQPGGGGRSPFRAGPSLIDESDDYAATIEKVYAFAQPRE
ncbi:TGF-beta propeptide [Nesidiocoris tenuis]|uniref:TGF-beta propeptide n=1 Tax=Nesidiocoris tenuis TaxID=355587 RepID=A0ABN7A5I1_9HEMI|nr:TGF-beta propeptide [Nesidiocoris tenuis]